LKALDDKPRSGRPIIIDGKSRAKITAHARLDSAQGACQMDFAAASGQGRRTWDL
jgi:hypothetical protein